MADRIAELAGATAAVTTNYEEQAGEWLTGYRSSGGRIYCGRGCRHCCDLVVNTTFPEAVAIAGSLDQALRERLAIYIDRLIRHLPSIPDFKSFLKYHRKVIGFCPFLDGQGACAIYPLRPLSCRSLLSTRPADWCAVDFSALHPLEKEAFLGSLDRQVVAYPSHFVAATQQLARNCEQEIFTAMFTTFGLALGGHLPSLVWLELECRVSRNLPRGAAWIAGQAEGAGLGAEYLLHFPTPTQGAR